MRFIKFYIFLFFLNFVYSQDKYGDIFHFRSLPDSKVFLKKEAIDTYWEGIKNDWEKESCLIVYLVNSEKKGNRIVVKNEILSPYYYSFKFYSDFMDRLLSFVDGLTEISTKNSLWDLYTKHKSKYKHIMQKAADNGSSEAGLLLFHMTREEKINKFNKKPERSIEHIKYYNTSPQYSDQYVTEQLKIQADQFIEIILQLTDDDIKTPLKKEKLKKKHHKKTKISAKKRTASEKAIRMIEDMIVNYENDFSYLMCIYQKIIKVREISTSDLNPNPNIIKMFIDKLEDHMTDKKVPMFFGFHSEQIKAQFSNWKNTLENDSHDSDTDMSAFILKNTDLKTRLLFNMGEFFLSHTNGIGVFMVNAKVIFSREKISQSLELSDISKTLYSQIRDICRLDTLDQNAEAPLLEFAEGQIGYSYIQASGYHNFQNKENFKKALMHLKNGGDGSNLLLFFTAMKLYMDNHISFDEMTQIEQKVLEKKCFDETNMSFILGEYYEYQYKFGKNIKDNEREVFCRKAISCYKDSIAKGHQYARFRYGLFLLSLYEELSDQVPEADPLNEIYNHLSHFATCETGEIDSSIEASLLFISAMYADNATPDILVKQKALGRLFFAQFILKYKPEEKEKAKRFALKASEANVADAHFLAGQLCMDDENYHEATLCFMRGGCKLNAAKSKIKENQLREKQMQEMGISLEKEPNKLEEYENPQIIQEEICENYKDIEQSFLFPALNDSSYSPLERAEAHLLSAFCILQSHECINKHQLTQILVHINRAEKLGYSHEHSNLLEEIQNLAGEVIVDDVLKEEAEKNVSTELKSILSSSGSAINRQLSALGSVIPFGLGVPDIDYVQEVELEEDCGNSFVKSCIRNSKFLREKLKKINDWGDDSKVDSHILSQASQEIIHNIFDKKLCLNVEHNDLNRLFSDPYFDRFGVQLKFTNKKNKLTIKSNVMSVGTHPTHEGTSSKRAFWSDVRKMLGAMIQRTPIK